LKGLDEEAEGIEASAREDKTAYESCGYYPVAVEYPRLSREKHHYLLEEPRGSIA
jgi:hypothetical protein